MVTSADCKEDYEKILNKKNGSEFFFETIEVVAAGATDPDENKLRESAKKGDYTKFKMALPSALREIDSRRLMNDMRQSLGLDMVKDEIKLVKDKLREQYFRGEIFKVGEVVESAGQQYEIVKRGSNHLLLKEQSGNLVSKWIQDVTVVEAVIQQSGTDDLDPPTVDIKSTFNIAKDVMRYKDFKKLNAMASGQVKEQEEHATDQVPYDEEPSEMELFLQTITGTQHTGHTLHATDDNHRRRKIAYHLGEGFSEDEVQMIDELSTELLGRYKKAAGEQASAADKAGNYAQGDKRFKGINKATNKQFDNDLKKHGQFKEAVVNFPKTKEDHPRKITGHDTEYAWAMKHVSKNKDDKISYQHNGVTIHHPDGKHTFILGGHKPIFDRDSKGKLSFKKDLSVASRAYVMPTKSANKNNVVSLKKEEVELELELEEAKKKKDKIRDDFKPTAVEVKMKDDSQQLGATNAHGFDAFFNEEEDMEPSEEGKDFSEEEIDKMIDSLTDDDFLEAYDDDELAVVDDETGEEMEEDKPEVTEQAILEVLSRMERMRARVRFAKSKSKRERSAKLALKRTSSTGTINKRARRLAVNLMKKRLMRGRPASSLSVGEKERIEKMVEKRRPILNRIAMKLTSRVRQVEKARLHHTKFTQSGSPGVSV